MAECDVCKKWYHEKCENIPIEVFKTTTAGYVTTAAEQFNCFLKWEKTLDISVNCIYYTLLLCLVLFAIEHLVA